MRLETVINVPRIQDCQRVTASYEQWIDPKTNKTEQKVKIYVIDLYDSKGSQTTHTNQHQVDRLA